MKIIITILCLFALTTQADAQRWGHRGGGFRGGGGFAGGMIGGVIGGVIGGAMSQPRYQEPYYQPPQFDPVAYCVQRFRSYNPNSGYYLGFDGRYHPCP